MASESASGAGQAPVGESLPTRKLNCKYLYHNNTTIDQGIIGTRLRVNHQRYNENEYVFLHIKNCGENLFENDNYYKVVVSVRYII